MLDRVRRAEFTGAEPHPLRRRAVTAVAGAHGACVLAVLRAARVHVFRRALGLTRARHCPLLCQSWIFEKSATWRRVVATTRESRLAMVAFSAVCFAAPVGLGLLVMNATNPSDQEERHKVLRARAGLDGKMLAKVRAREHESESP